MSAKEFVRPDDLVRDSFTLAKQIHDSGFAPEALIVLWRGGTPVGIIVHEFLRYKGLETYHTAIKAESYVGIERRIEPRVENMEPVLEHIPPRARVLVIDDIFDSGLTVRKVRELVAARTDRVKIATLYYRTAANQTDLSPDFFVHRTERWIVFPHELMDLTPEEIRRKDPYIHSLLA